MDKPLPRLTTNDALDVILAVDKCQHVSDMGIAALSFVARFGTCSLHGEVSDEVEVSNGVALAESMIRCATCQADFGITRKVPVEAVGPVERG